MSLKQIIPGVFVVSVPVNDAAAFEEFFPAFKQTYLDHNDDSPYLSPAILLGKGAGRRSPFPEPPTPPPVIPPWMAGNDDPSLKNTFNSVIKAQHQHPTVPQGGEFKSCIDYAELEAIWDGGDFPPQPTLKPPYLNPSKGLAILTNPVDGPGNYPPPIPEKPAYPKPPKGRAICSTEQLERIAADTYGCKETPFTDPFRNTESASLRSHPHPPSKPTGLWQFYPFIDN